ncbi:Protein of unknown function [Gryllus bimaculatus]|nr:Protein of unknown function [Gryllus bimaculatus]
MKREESAQSGTVRSTCAPARVQASGGGGDGGCVDGGGGSGGKGYFKDRAVVGTMVVNRAVPNGAAGRRLTWGLDPVTCGHCV